MAKAINILETNARLKVVLCFIRIFLLVFLVLSMFSVEVSGTYSIVMIMLFSSDIDP